MSVVVVSVAVVAVVVLRVFHLRILGLYVKGLNVKMGEGNIHQITVLVRRNIEHNFVLVSLEVTIEQ